MQSYSTGFCSTLLHSIPFHSTKIYWKSLYLGPIPWNWTSPLMKKGDTWQDDYSNTLDKDSIKSHHVWWMTFLHRNSLSPILLIMKNSVNIHHILWTKYISLLVYYCFYFYFVIQEFITSRSGDIRHTEIVCIWKSAHYHYAATM